MVFAWTCMIIGMILYVLSLIMLIRQWRKLSCTFNSILDFLRFTAWSRFLLAGGIVFFVGLYAYDVATSPPAAVALCDGEKFQVADVELEVWGIPLEKTAVPPERKMVIEYQGNGYEIDLATCGMTANAGLGK